MSSTEFWIKEPCVLFSNLAIFPTQEMTKNEKLNALTRLAILATIIMYFMKYEWWFTFLILALLIIVILAYTNNPDTPEKEDFTVTPTYMGTDLTQTTVAPAYSSEQVVYPPAYDLYTEIPQPDTFEQPLEPRYYPYGQYLTKTNLLPSDEYYVHLGCGNTRNAREYVNSTFLRNDLAYRENSTRILKKKMARRFRQKGNGSSFSPFVSY